MALQHHNYSRLVSLLKVGLPLVALFLLGTVFLLTADDSFDPGFTFTQAEFDALEQGSFLDNSNINGRTANGDVFSMMAERIEPQDRKLSRINAFDMVSDFDFVTGQSARISASVAQIVNADRTLLFPEGAYIVTSDGYEGSVESVIVNLETGDIYGSNIESDGPLGHISAERFHISSILKANSENRVLSFENAVNVVLNTPEPKE